MAKVKKTSLKAVRNRERVSFHRRWRAIAFNESQSINRNPNFQNVNHESLRQDEQKQTFFNSNEKLRRWAIQYNISKRAVSELLKILISLGMTGLPKDSRTLLETPRNVEMISLSNGKLWFVDYFGFFFIFIVFKSAYTRLQYQFITFNIGK